MADEDNVVPYEVEAIRAFKVSRGVRQYLIKWKDYAESDNTWEPEEHCDCEEKIKEFHEQLKEKKKKDVEQTRKKVTTSQTRTKITKSRSKFTVKKRILDSDIESTDADSNKSEIDESNKNVNSSKPSTHETETVKAKIVESDDDFLPTLTEEEGSEENLDVVIKTQDKRNSYTESSGKDELKSKSDPLSEVVRFENEELEPEGIIGAIESLGELMFLVKWKNQNKADLISSEIAKLACPQIVLQYYEKKLVWNDSLANSN